MSKTDVSRQAKRIETVPRAGAGRARRGEVVAIVGRRQVGEMVDDASRGQAKAPTREFAENGWDEV